MKSIFMIIMCVITVILLFNTNAKVFGLSLDRAYEMGVVVVAVFISLSCLSIMYQIRAHWNPLKTAKLFTTPPRERRILVLTEFEGGIIFWLLSLLVIACFMASVPSLRPYLYWLF